MALGRIAKGIAGAVRGIEVPVHRRSGGGAGRVRVTWRNRRPFCASTSRRTSRTRRTERQSAFMARCRSAVTRGVRISCVSRSGAALSRRRTTRRRGRVRSGCPSRGSRPPRGNRGRRRRGRVRAPAKAPAHLAGRRLPDGTVLGPSAHPLQVLWRTPQQLEYFLVLTPGGHLRQEGGFDVVHAVYHRSADVRSGTYADAPAPEAAVLAVPLVRPLMFLSTCPRSHTYRIRVRLRCTERASTYVSLSTACLLAGPAGCPAGSAAGYPC